MVRDDLALGNDEVGVHDGAGANPGPMDAFAEALLEIPNPIKAALIVIEAQVAAVVDERIADVMKHVERIARHSPTLKSRVDSFITSGEWIDLERIFKASWITGGSTGLKAIAPLAGCRW